MQERPSENKSIIRRYTPLLLRYLKEEYNYVTEQTVASWLSIAQIRFRREIEACLRIHGYFDISSIFRADTPIETWQIEQCTHAIIKIIRSTGTSLAVVSEDSDPEEAVHIDFLTGSIIDRETCPLLTHHQLWYLIIYFLCHQDIETTSKYMEIDYNNDDQNKLDEWLYIRQNPSLCIMYHNFTPPLEANTIPVYDECIVAIQNTIKYFQSISSNAQLDLVQAMIQHYQPTHDAIESTSRFINGRVNTSRLFSKRQLTYARTVHEFKKIEQWSEDTKRHLTREIFNVEHNQPYRVDYTKWGQRKSCSPDSLHQLRAMIIADLTQIAANMASMFYYQQFKELKSHNPLHSLILEAGHTWSTQYIISHYQEQGLHLDLAQKKVFQDFIENFEHSCALLTEIEKCLRRNLCMYFIDEHGAKISLSKADRTTIKQMCDCLIGLLKFEVSCFSIQFSDMEHYALLREVYKKKYGRINIPETADTIEHYQSEKTTSKKTTHHELVLFRLVNEKPHEKVDNKSLTSQTFWLNPRIKASEFDTHVHTLPDGNQINVYRLSSAAEAIECIYSVFSRIEITDIPLFD